MNASLTAIVPKLEKLLPLLSSSQPGEVVATAAAIGRTLRTVGADWHDLTAVLTRAAPLRADGEGAPLIWRDIPPAEQAGWLAKMSASRRLSAWEMDFCSSILAQVRFRPWSRLSVKQLAILDRCVGKFIAEGR